MVTAIRRGLVLLVIEALQVNWIEGSCPVGDLLILRQFGTLTKREGGDSWVLRAT